MQSTSRFHHIIDVVVYPIAAFLNDNLTPFDTPNVVLYGDPNFGNLTILLFLSLAQFPVAGLFLRLLIVTPAGAKP